MPGGMSFKALVEPGTKIHNIGGVIMWKLLGWLFVVFAVWFLVSNPTGAAAAVDHLLNALKGAGTSISVFLTSL